MEMNKKMLEKASENGILSADQAERLWFFLGESNKEKPHFSFVHVLYYLGGLIAISAMSLFMTIGWESFGGWGIFFISLVYAAAGIGLTEFFLYRKGLRIPAGITATFVVVLTPLAIYGLQKAFGLWVDGEYYRDYHAFINWRWMLMELGTLACGAMMLWRYRLPFLVMPIAATLWYMSMDLAPTLQFILTGEDSGSSWELRRIVSLYFGLVMMMLALWVDIKNRSERDFAFWLYIFGVATFWGGLSFMDSSSQLDKFIYFCLNLLMIFVGAMLSRRVFAVFGALGAYGYLGYLSYRVFEDSLLFPFSLTGIGLAMILIGVRWQKKEGEINSYCRSFLPAPLRDMIERRQ